MAGSFCLRTELLFNVELIEEFITRPRLVGFGACVHVNDLPLSFSEFRPGVQPFSVRIADLDEVGEALLHNYQDLVVVRRPQVNLVRVEIAHRVLDLASGGVVSYSDSGGSTALKTSVSSPRPNFSSTRVISSRSDLASLPRSFRVVRR